MMLKTGDAVISAAGHDRGQRFVVIAVDGEFALIADGRRRTIGDPKRKKLKHLKPAGNIGEELSEQLKEKSGVFREASGTGDAWLRKALKALEPK